MKARNLVLSVLLMVMTAGCSLSAYSQHPSIAAQLQQSMSVIAPRPISDMDTFLYAEGIASVYGGRSTTAQIADLGGALALGGLSTAATIASNGRASPSVEAAIVSAGSFLMQALGVVNPQQRANALAEGGNVVREGQSEFFLCLAAYDIGSPSTKAISKCGAQLYAKTNSAISSVERIMVGMLPRASDFENIKPAIPALLKSFPDPRPDPVGDLKAN